MGVDKADFSEIKDTMVSGQPLEWRRIAIESAGYVFLIWAAIVAFNVFAFTDPAARGLAYDGLSHIPQILTHLPRNVVLLLGLFVAVAASIAPGDALLRAFRIPPRDAFDRIAFGLIAGLVVLTIVAYALAALQLLRWEVEATLLIVGAVASASSIRRWVREAPLVPDSIRVPRALSIVVWFLLAASLYVALLAAVIPEIGFDARYYHLAEAERYAQHGGFYNLVAAERIWPFALPHYQETLYAFAWVLFGAIGAKLVSWMGAVATAVALVAFSRAWFSSTVAGAMAALMVVSTPVFAWSATTANNDLAAVPIVILALHAVLTWRANGSLWALGGAGLLAGFTYGIKPFGVFTVIALGIIAAWILITRRARRNVVASELAAYAACAVLGMLPALITATWMIGDPIFPLAVNAFPSRYGSASLGATVSTAVGTSLIGSLSLTRILSLPWLMTMQSATFRDLIGPIWLTLMPVWVAVPFLARRHAGVIRPLAAFAAIVTGLAYVGGAIELRYILVALPAVALLTSYGILCVDWSRARALQVILVASLVVFSALENGLVTPLQRNAEVAGVMGQEYFNWGYLYEGVPDAAIQLQFIPMLQYANAHLDPHHDKIYDAVGLQLMNVYSEVEIFNGTYFVSPGALHEWTLESPDAYAHLRECGCTYIVVPRETLATLRPAAVWRHLRFVVETGSMNGPTTRDELLKVVD